MKVPQSNALIYPENILNVTPAGFSTVALTLFRFQYEYCPVYRAFCDALKVNVATVTELSKIPFLPISFFRSHRVVSGNQDADAELLFESSGTTAEQTSRHFVASKSVYEDSLSLGFRAFYGDPREYTILALLPSYLERPNASLVYMAKSLMSQSGSESNGFFLDEWAELAGRIQELELAGKKTLLLGVTFALLDFADAFPMALNHTIVMETGGMKGRKKEMTREEVHVHLKERFGLLAIHSEYGMTEMLSQAYSLRDGVFSPSPTMCVMVRDINDPLDVSPQGSGALNVIDLANIYSCSFIATDDMGAVSRDGSFTVAGRLDHTILRGCSQMVI